jgi:outer membrane receptor protein involved in Fe transport
MKKMLNLMFLLGLLIPTSALQAQGIVRGVVQSADGRNLTEVLVEVKALALSTSTDVDGRYQISLPAGKHLIQFSKKDFSDESVNVEVENGAEVYQNMSMTASKTMDGVVIRVKPKATAATAVGAIQTKKNLTQLAEVVSMEDMKKVNIRTTADALKRIPGATIMEGKFANIRGMYDRYNAGYLNGAPLPSTESDRKAFSFDIIPANMIDNITVIKSGTPDMMGDFGGGIIRIGTRNIPDKITHNLSMGFQFNSITTFKDLQSFGVQGSEWFGISGSSRNIPALNGSLASVNPQTNAEESRKFNNDWSLKRINPMPGPRFNYTIGVPVKLKGKKELGFIAGINYALTNRYSDGVVNKNDLSDNRQYSSYSDKMYSFNVQNGMLFNASFKLNNRNRIDWKNLYNLNYDAASTLRNGLADADNQLYAEAYANQISANKLYSTQLLGSHSLGEKQTTVNWMLNYGSIKRDIPDYRIAQYGIQEGTRFLILNDFFNNGSGRFFSNLDEKTVSGSVDVQHSIKTGKLTNNLKTGVFVQRRNRDFNSREFVYGPMGKQVISTTPIWEDLAQDKLRDDGLFLIEKTTPDADEYRATSSLNAAYVMAEHHYPLFVVNKKPYMLKFIYGLRVEQFEQKLQNDYFNKLGRDLSHPGRNTDLLPSANLIAPLGMRSNLRAAYYKTVNRPEMRELAPFAFYNFNINSEIVGNTKLKRAEIQNFDVRYEVYPGGENMISVGAFYKKIINPIEFSLNTTQALIRTFEYANEDVATVGGLELEARKNLDFLGKIFKTDMFKHMTLYANLAVIHSNVDYTGIDGKTYTRQLQGQSPYVANISLFYEHPQTGIVFNTSYNKLGSRIAYIGVDKSVQPFGTNIYEYGRGVWDVQIGKNFKKSGTVRCTLGDLLAQNAVFYQDLNENKRYDKSSDNTLFSFTYGRTITLSYSFTF